MEIFLNTLPDGRTFLQLTNLSGFNGVTMEQHLPIHGVTVTLPAAFTRVTALDGLPVPQLTCDNGQTTLSFAPLALYQAYVLE